MVQQGLSRFDFYLSLRDEKRSGEMMLGAVSQVVVNKDCVYVMLGKKIMNRFVLLTTIIGHKNRACIFTPSAVDVISAPPWWCLRLPYCPCL
jgi:hypothetical protein